MALAALLLVPTGTAAFAEIPMSGRFVAEATCSAGVSIREPVRNPGDVATEAGRSYPLVARNASPGSHYLIVVAEAEPQRRWVAFGCGRVVEASVEQATAGSSETPPMPGADAPARGRYVLAASWHPAFCETQPRARECRNGGEGDGFTLHGLWPQPREQEYCGVPARIVAADEAGDWLDLPDPELSPTLDRRLGEAMPGAVAGLDRHEWWKHGTCHGGDAEDYFADSIRLLDELNGSAVRDLFVSSIGESLTASDIRDAFDEAFGRGAGSRVLVDCVDVDGDTLIQELRIELAGSLSPAQPLGAMMLAARTVPEGCGNGRVDAPA